MENEPHDLMKVPEVAAGLRTSKMTVYRLIKAGRLDAIRVGRGFRIRRASFQAYLEEGGPT